MPNIINPRKAFLTQSGENLNGAARNSLNNLADQLRLPSSGARYTNALPKGNGEGDQNTTVAQDGTVTLTTYDKLGNPMSVNVAADSSTNLAFKTGTAAPALTDYPNDGDNGWFYNTTASQLWYVRNYQGTLVYINFVSVSGTITDAQHGDRGGGTLHAAVTGAANGFMIAADKTKLDNAVSTATASRLVIRDGTAGAAFGGTLTYATATGTTLNATDVNSTTVNATTADMSSQYRVGGTRVVTSRQTGWTIWTGTRDRTVHGTYTAAAISSPPTQAEVQSIANSLQNVSRAFAALADDLGVTSGHGLTDW